MRINKIHPSSLGKIQAIFFGIAGFFLGILLALIGNSILDDMLADFPEFSGLSIIIWIFGITIIPILFYIIGFFLGILESLIYNAVSKRIGGIKIETDESRIFISGVS